MSAETEFFLASLRSVVKLETLEISHPNFSKTYFIVRNARQGITAKLETGASQFFEYRPIRLTNLGARDDLDTGIRVTWNELGQILPKELDRIEAGDGYKITPKVKFRVYSSADLEHVLQGPYAFELKTVSQNQANASFDAKAPRLNYSATGELYKIDRFVMLRGFL